jgi:ribokinase
MTRTRAVIAGADAVLVQLQQPAPAALAAARIGREAGRLVVLDGEVTDRRLLAFADVVRADEREAQGLDEHVLDQGPSLLALAQTDANLFLWRGGRLRVPLTGAKVVDTTGGWDAFTAALTAALLRKLPYEEAARLATAAAGTTVSHISGGRSWTRPADRAVPGRRPNPGPAAGI